MRSLIINERINLHLIIVSEFLLSGRGAAAATSRGCLSALSCRIPVGTLLLLGALGDTEDRLEVGPDLLPEKLVEFLVQERQIVSYVAGSGFGWLRSVHIPIAIDPQGISFLELFLGLDHGGLVLFPAEEIPIILVLALESLDKLRVVAIVLSKDGGNLVQLVGVVLFVKTQDTLSGDGTHAETKADLSHNVVLLEESPDVITGVNQGGQDGGSNHHDQKNQWRGLDPLVLRFCLWGTDGSVTARVGLLCLFLSNQQ
mmetsp:Transcript_563/g.1158  ORF Transcript_563/g.1158 Transcript_563/m.1158 type:complete len:257 (-) Transcript_563:309-1079(-)